MLSYWKSIKGGSMEKETQVAGGGQENRQAAPAGIFDDKKKPKEDFKDVGDIAAQTRAETASKKRLPPSQSEVAASQTNSAINSSGDNVQKELDDLDKITEQDMELAEQLVFKGYAEFDVKMKKFDKYSFTICSTNAEEMSILDEVIYDLVKKAKDRGDGTVDLPQNYVSTMRNALYVAISYRGMNKKELMEGNVGCYLNTIKTGLAKVTDMFGQGEVEKAGEFKESIKKSLIKRAGEIKKLPTPIIDFLSGAKFDFDDKMIQIMSHKDIIPKS